MQISQEGIDLIKKHEGLRLRAYLCPAGVWTIGYGTTGPQIKAGMVITKAEAEAYLRNDLVKFTTGVIKLCAPKVPTQNELDALVSFSYNVGLAALGKSTILRCYKAGNKEAAANGFDLWTKARDPKTKQLRPLPGLVARRTDEKRLFMANHAEAVQERIVSASKTATVPEASVVPVEPKSLAKSREIIGGAVAGLGGIGQLITGINADDAEQIKTSTTQLQEDSSRSATLKHMHVPELAAGLTVALSVFIIWKRITDRKHGVR